MSEEKQIEEMARGMVDSDNKEAADALSLFFVKVAEHLYNAGYRKQSDVAREIFEHLECMFSPVFTYTGHTIKEYIAELKKKYTEEKI